MNNYSPLLINEPALQVLPSLAVAVGLNEAIIVQQLHYWITNPKVGVQIDGFKWVHNSYSEWQANFPFWSERTIRRIFSDLEEKGLVVTEQFNKMKGDATKFYRIAYDRLVLCPQDNLSTDPEDKVDASTNTETTIPETTENREVILKRKTVRKVHVPRVCNSTELFEKDEVPTRQDMSATAKRKRDEQLRETYDRIHEIAGLTKPVAFPKSDQTCLTNALREGATVDRLGIAWKKALETSEARFWPFHCVVEKLHLLEAQLKKKPTFDERHLTPQEVEDARGARLQATFDKILGRV